MARLSTLRSGLVCYEQKAQENQWPQKLTSNKLLPVITKAV